MPITRTPMIDDDGSGTTGTVINAAWKTELYNQIDAADLAAGGFSSGTWLPTLQGDGGVSGQTYNTRAGTWLRVGNQIFVEGSVTLTAKGTLTGTVLAIGGLPVPAVGPGTFNVAYFLGLGIAVVHLAAYVSGSAAYLLYTGAAATSTANMVPAHLTDATSLIFSGSYTV
jgi:hypothetical protein